MRYRAFISYSHQDARWAGWLHRKLEGYRVPPRLRGLPGAYGRIPASLTPIFRDREELASAGELGPKIQSALADSDALVVVCSPAAAQSRWVDAEIRRFQALGRGDRVYALIVAGEPNAGGPAECFPPALRGVAGDDSGPDDGAAGAVVEPIAADVRPGKDGRTLARLKLLAGLLGVDLDRLRQREATRRHRRLLAIAALALLVAISTSYLAFQAMEARDAAERRQKQAEALVGFMLGDLNDKLARLSRLDILESVNDQAMGYFESLPTRDVTDDTLAQRAQALVKIGNVRMDQGQLDAALRSYRAAELLAGRLARAAPADLERQLAHADVLAFIGTAQWYLGDLPQAERQFLAARTVLRQAGTGTRPDARVLFQLSTLDNNLGHVLERRGEFDAAAAHYRDMLASARALADIDPGNRDWTAQRGLAHGNLARMALLRGDLAQAVRDYRRDVEIEQALASAEPGDNAQAERRVLAQAALGRTLALVGEVDAAVAELQAALAGAERLLALEPGSAAFREDRALYAVQLARLLRLQGDMAAAVPKTLTGLADFVRLRGQNADNPAWTRGLAEARMERAAQLMDARRPAEARRQASDALALLERLLAAQPQDRTIVLATLDARLQQARWRDDPAAARRLRSRNLDTLAAQATAPTDPRLLALRAQTFADLGQQARAAEVLPALWATGYRDPGAVAVLEAAGLPAPPQVPQRAGGRATGSVAP